MKIDTHSTADQVTPEQLKIAYSGPSFASDKFIVTIGQTGVRIAFGENTPDSQDMNLRTSVTMHPLDAIRLRRLLTAMLKQYESDWVSAGALPPEGNSDG